MLRTEEPCPQVDQRNAQLPLGIWWLKLDIFISRSYTAAAHLHKVFCKAFLAGVILYTYISQ